MTVGDVRDVMYRDRRPLGGLMMRPAADEKKGQSGNSSLGVAGVEWRSCEDKDVSRQLVYFRHIVFLLEHVYFTVWTVTWSGSVGTLVYM